MIDRLLEFQTLAGLNIVANAWLLGIAVCRCGKLVKGHSLFRVRIQYIMLVPLSIANGAAPIMFQQYAPAVSVVFALGVATIFTLDSFQWRKGPPPSTDSRVGELRRADGRPL